MNRVLFRGAQVVYPLMTDLGNVLVENGRILDAHADSHAAADEVVEVGGRYLMPGIIDDQVHFREPGLTHKENLASASRACAAGGVTSFLEMPNTIPNAITIERVREKQVIANEKSLVNYGFYIGATPDNISELKRADTASDIPGIKIFIGSSTGDLLVDSQEALERIFAETKIRICAHCEDETTVQANSKRLDGGKSVSDHSKIRDRAAAVIATRRAIDLATRHKHPFHVLHVSTADEIPLIAGAKQFVTAEVCLHHLFFNVDDYERLGTRIQMNPSIKTKADCQSLWQSLLDGIITVIATDHAPHTLEEKSKPYPASPSGLPAVENSLALMLNEVAEGRCSIGQVAWWMSTNPASVWKIDRKGRIKVGFDGDLVIVDLEQRRTIEDRLQHALCKWSPWDGVTLQGWPVATYIAGQRVWSQENGFQKPNESINRQLSFRGEG
jgi:dihydroorotase